jgi:TrmH family RNA methyltransferase
MVLATAEMPARKIGELNFPGALTLALDGITDPGNMGTIIRTADWFGIDQIVCSPGSVDVYNPKVVQAAMGSLFRMQIVYSPLNNFLEKAAKEVTVYGTFIDGTSIVSHPLSKGGIIIIGSESHGISKEIFPYIHHRLSIPRPGQTATTAESLNAAIATAIVCYEFTKKSGQLL